MVKLKPRCEDGNISDKAPSPKPKETAPSSPVPEKHQTREQQSIPPSLSPPGNVSPIPLIEDHPDASLVEVEVDEFPSNKSMILDPETGFLVPENTVPPPRCSTPVLQSVEVLDNSTSAIPGLISVPPEGATLTISDQVPSRLSSRIEMTPAPIISAQSRKPVVLSKAKLIPIKRTTVSSTCVTPSSTTSATPPLITSTDATPPPPCVTRSRGLANMLRIPAYASADSINDVQSILCQTLKLDSSKLNSHAACSYILL